MRASVSGTRIDHVMDHSLRGRPTGFPDALRPFLSILVQAGSLDEVCELLLRVLPHARVYTRASTRVVISNNMGAVGITGTRGGQGVPELEVHPSRS